MFARRGTIVYPQTPLLTVTDVWAGDGFRVHGRTVPGDSGRLLLGISGGPWGYAQRWAIVSMADYCYTLYGGGKTFRPVALSSVSALSGVTSDDRMRWTGDGGGDEALHFADGGWYIDSTAYGEGNRYVVSWNAHDATATPVGPWTDDEDPPDDITLELDWPRRVCARAIGLFVPASNYCRNPPSGNIQTGIPTWGFAYAGVSYTAYKTQYGYAAPADRHDPSYVVADANGETAARMVWDGIGYASRTPAGNTVTGGTPADGSDWTLTLTRPDGTTETINAGWAGYAEGPLAEGRWMFETARLA